MDESKKRTFLFPSVVPEQEAYDTGVRTSASLRFSHVLNADDGAYYRPNEIDSKADPQEDWLQLKSFKPESNTSSRHSEYGGNSEEGCETEHQQDTVLDAFENDIVVPQKLSSSDDMEVEETFSRKHRKEKRKHKRKSNKKHHKQRLKRPGEKAQRVITDLIQDFGKEDKQADINNVLFGSLYKLDVAETRTNTFSCLGLPVFLQSLWNPKSKKDKVKSRGSISRYFRKIDMDHSKKSDNNEEFLVTKILKESYDDSCDFMAFTKPLEKSKDEHLQSLKLAGGISQASTLEISQQVHQRLSEEPHNVELWMKFIDMQSEMYKYSNSNEGDKAVLSKSSEHSINQRKLSIVEKAIILNPKAEKLLLKEMELRATFEDYVILANKWNSLVFKFPNSALLWTEFIHFHMSCFSQFTVSSMITKFNKCFKALIALLEGTFLSHDAGNIGAKETLSIFYLFFLFLKHSGYTERAVASFQALLEFNLYMPAELEESSLAVCKGFFEPFWDSSSPRFSEENAKGWSKWMAVNNKSRTDGYKIKSLDLSRIVQDVYKERENPSDDQICQMLPLNEAWHKIETDRSFHNCGPVNNDVSSGNEDVNIDDPDRLVLYDDISGCLFRLRAEDDKLTMLLLYLLGLGCLIPATEIPENIRKSIKYAEVYKFLDIEEISALDFISSNFSYDGMLSTWSEYFLCTEQHKSLSAGRVHCIRIALDQSLLIFEKRYIRKLSLIWFQFEIFLYDCVAKGETLLVINKAEKSRKAVSRLGKELLRIPANRDNISLWSVYCQFEWAHGDRAEASRMFELAISMFSSHVEKQGEKEHSYLRLCRTYAELLLGILSLTEACPTDRCSALNVLFRSVCPEAELLSNSGVNGMAPSELLRRRRRFKEKHRELMACNDSREQSDLIEFTMAYSLFEYASAGIEEFNNVINQTTGLIGHEGPNLIETYQLCILLHNVQVCKTNFPRLRCHLRNVMHHNPDNLSLVYLFVKTFRGGLSSLVVRKYFNEWIDKSYSLLPWIGLISYELLKEANSVSVLNGRENSTAVHQGKDPDLIEMCLPSTEPVNRLRAVFSRAVASQDGKHCVALWRQFMQYEVSHGNYKEAKGIFYQALQSCPWAKDIYLDGAQHFASDLQEIVDIMQEKEIRICFPLEEVEILKG